MKLLHTADWHLGDRLRHIDRTDDLRRAVDQVAGYCTDHDVDVLVVAGDLFSELARADGLQQSLAYLSGRFRPLLLSGMSILAVSGNHDNDTYCELLRRAFQLAAPVLTPTSGPLPGGRMYLANRPCRLELADRARRVACQFVCMPYPNAARYFRGRQGASYRSLRNRSRLLRAAYIEQLDQLANQLDARRGSVLVSHLHVLGDAAPPELRAAAEQDVSVKRRDLHFPWSYVALGHIHGAQSVDSQQHVRYAGSIERLSIREQHDDKSVTLVELEPDGLRRTPIQLPLVATPFYDVHVRAPRRELPHLAGRYPHAAQALVRCHVRFDPRADNLFAILSELTRIFPRCYERTWAPLTRRAPSATSATAPDGSVKGHVAEPGGQFTADSAGGFCGIAASRSSLAATVTNYLRQKLAGDPDRATLLSMAEQVLEQLE